MRRGRGVVALGAATRLVAAAEWYRLSRLSRARPVNLIPVLITGASTTLELDSTRQSNHQHIHSCMTSQQPAPAPAVTCRQTTQLNNN